MTYPANKTLTYAYDAAGNRATLVDPEGGVSTYSYDGRNLLSWLVNPLAERTTWVYDVLGRVTTMTHANAATAEHDYDAVGRETAVRNLKSDRSVLSIFTYSYDVVGNRLAAAEANGDLATWSYDETYQLTRERRSGTNAYDTTYTYDGVGNRLTKVESGAITTYSCDVADELLTQEDSSGVTTFTYDANGNRVSKRNPSNQIVTHTWDADNRMTCFTDVTAQATSFSYDGDGRLRQRQGAADTTNALWDGENVLLETDSGGTTQVAYTLEPALYGNLLSQRRAGASSFHHFDSLGSTRNLSDVSEVSTDTRDFKAFGVINGSSGATQNRFWFVGRQGYWSDPIGYLLLRARWYDATGGLLLTREPPMDTGLLNALAPQTTRSHPYSDFGIPRDTWERPPHPYSYVGNRPTFLVDPSGMILGDPAMKCRIAAFARFLRALRPVFGLSEFACLVACGALDLVTLEITFLPCLGLCQIGVLSATGIKAHFAYRQLKKDLKECERKCPAMGYDPFGRMRSGRAV